MNLKGCFRKYCCYKSEGDFRFRMLAFREAGGEPPSAPITKCGF